MEWQERVSVSVQRGLMGQLVSYVPLTDMAQTVKNAPVHKMDNVAMEFLAMERVSVPKDGLARTVTINL